MSLYEWTMTIARKSLETERRTGELEFLGHLVASHMALTANIQRGKGGKTYKPSDFFDTRTKKTPAVSKQTVIDRFREKPIKSKLNGG